MEIPDRDKLIYSPTRPVVERLLPPPEKPMPRPAPPPANASPQTEQAPAAVMAPTPAAPTPPAARTQQSAAAPLAPPGKSPQLQPAPPKTANAKASSARLQLGSVRSEDTARQEWERIKKKNADLLGSLSATPIRADLGDKGIYYRVQTGPVADPAEAERICGELKQRSVGCILVR
jgi:cell division septation protein DedD